MGNLAFRVHFLWNYIFPISVFLPSMPVHCMKNCVPSNLYLMSLNHTMMIWNWFWFPIIDQTLMLILLFSRVWIMMNYKGFYKTANLLVYIDNTTMVFKLRVNCLSFIIGQSPYCFCIILNLRTIEKSTKVSMGAFYQEWRNCHLKFFDQRFVRQNIEYQPDYVDEEIYMEETRTTLFQSIKI